jgi:hypothetical protein
LLPFALLLATPALADTDVSTLIAAQGLYATEVQLAALPAPTPSDRFALGGVRFLMGIEAALQTRYRTGISDGLSVMSGLPVLRLPIAENPTPEPFIGQVIASLFARVGADMSGALAALAPIADGDTVGVMIDTDDIWFDIDLSGTRTEGEGLTDLAGLGLNGGFGAPLAGVQIRFDTADAAWLAAYAHLLAGFSDLVLAFDPTVAIDDVLAARAAIAEVNAAAGSPYGSGMGYQVGDYADLAAMVVDALERQPDPALTRSAQAHWLEMVAQNRVFWRRVATETDNEAEWIPNKAQVSALGLPFPPDTGQVWLNVLGEAEALLKGEVLMPHWRLADGVGIDLNLLFQDPPVVDVLGMAHGMDLLPYGRQGRLISGDALWRFETMMAGDAGLYMVILN